MLSKLRNGEKLSKEDIATLEGLYKTNHSIREELDKLTEDLTDKDLMDYVKDGVGMVSEALDRLEKMTLEENRAALEKGMEKIKEKGAGMGRTAPEAGEKDESAIDCAKAEELCKGYFQKYNINDYQCVGETVNHNYSAYNVQGYDEKGSMLFAEIDRKSGKLITFDYYEEASAENFDIDNAERIAEEFLESLGYENMTLARLSESGSTSDFTFVYEMDGVAYYPDTVHVKVCRTRGLVCGLDATKYLKNHRGRVEVSAKINLETAYGKLSEKLSVEASRLAVVSTARGERTAYEFLCSYEDEKYFVYLSAETGEEISIINARAIG
jgi:spore germination protein